jgi:hypothetical protein
MGLKVNGSSIIEVLGGKNVRSLMNHLGITLWRLCQIRRCIMRVVLQAKPNATPKQDGNSRIGVPTTNMVDEGIDSIWWG